MKIITPDLLRFAFSITVQTIFFKVCLSYGIENDMLNLTMMLSAFYGALMFFFGWFFGKKDSEYLPIFDIGFRFHLSAYIIYNGISILWFASGFGSDKESLSVLLYIAIYWTILVAIHFIFYLMARKRTIDSLNKEDIFE